MFKPQDINLKGLKGKEWYQTPTFKIRRFNPKYHKRDVKQFLSDKLNELEKEIDKSKVCVSTIAFHECKKYPKDCWFNIESNMMKLLIKKIFEE